MDQQGARPSVGCQAGVEKNANGKKVASNSRLRKLTASAEKHGIDIVCIQEHRIFHDDIDIKHHDMKNKWVLLTSSVEKALNNTTIRGAGMLLSPKAYKSLNSVETIRRRTMIASFNGNPAVTIISCYNPNVSDEEDKDEFYTKLTTIARSIPKHNILLVGGDMNAKIGKRDVMGSVYNDTTNGNGQRLLDYMQDCRLKHENSQTNAKENSGHPDSLYSEQRIVEEK